MYSVIIIDRQYSRILCYTKDSKDDFSDLLVASLDICDDYFDITYERDAAPPYFSIRIGKTSYVFADEYRVI